MNKTKYISKFVFNYLLLIIILTLAELIFRALSGFAILDWASLRIFIGLNIISIIISLLTSLLNEKVSRIVTLIVGFALSIYTFLQIGFVNYLGVYISFGVSSQGGAVKEYIGEFLASFSWTYYLILLPTLLMVLLLIIFRKKLKYFEFTRKSRFYLIFVGIILVVLSLTYRYTLVAKYMQDPLQQVTNKELAKEATIPSLTIKEFGTIGYGILDVIGRFSPIVEDEVPDI